MGETVWTDYYGTNNQGTAVSSVSSCIRDLSSCHRCGLRFPIDGSIDRFRILESKWRIVLLCYDCLDGVRSAKVCSYCLLAFPELEKGLFDCIICSCRVHSACLPLHHRNLWFSQLDTANFMCVDCCPIVRFRGAGFKKSSDSASQSEFNYLLEDLSRGEKSIPEKKVIGDGKERKNTVKKSMLVRSSSEVMEKTEGDVQLASTCTNFSVSDEQLALQLHRSVNGSQRISRSLCPKGETHLTISRKVQDCNSSNSRIVESTTCGHLSKVQVCQDNKSLLEDRESSQSILTSSHLEKSEEDLSKEYREHNTEGLASFSPKDRELKLESPDSTSYESNSGSILLPSNSLKSQLNDNLALEKYSVDVIMDSIKLQRKTIDAPSLDRYKKQYFRRQWGSQRNIGS